MSNEKKQFVAFRKYLQEKIDLIVPGDFKVSSERNLNSDFIEGETVVSALTGSVYDDSANIPYQIEIFTSKPDETINIFTSLAKANNNKPFQSIVNEGTNENPIYKNYTIIPFCQTPTVMDKDLPYGTEHYSRLMMFATLIILFQVSNVQSITIDGEEIQFLNGSLTYTTELFSSRVSGQELNKNKKKVSTLGLSFKIVNKDTIFTRRLFNIMVGQLKGNTAFNVQITMSNGMSATLKMIVNTNALSFARQSLTSDDVSLFLYDDRGEENAYR